MFSDWTGFVETHQAQQIAARPVARISIHGQLNHSSCIIKWTSPSMEGSNKEDAPEGNTVPLPSDTYYNMLSPHRPPVDSSADSEPLTARHKASRCLHKTFDAHWMLLVLAACFCAAKINPDPGAAAYSTAIKILVPALFCIVGLTIDLRALTTLADVKTVAANLLCQSYSLVVMPLVYYISVYHWQWEVHTGIVSSSLAPGIMAAMCMPTTTSTGTVMCVLDILQCAC